MTSSGPVHRPCHSRCPGRQVERLITTSGASRGAPVARQRDERTVGRPSRISSTTSGGRAASGARRADARR
jgi:hypothetical protein